VSEGGLPTNPTHRFDRARRRAGSAALPGDAQPRVTPNLRTVSEREYLRRPGALAGSSARCREGNRLYLNELIRIAENRDAKQCAGRLGLTESGGYCTPRQQ
jgi:hypothetical protein